MIGRLAALILLCTMSQTIDLPPQMPLTVAELGDNLNLTCSISGSEAAGLIYWYKVKFGYMIQTVAGGTTYSVSLEGQFVNPRFSITPGVDLYFLNIKNVSKEDEATYICQVGSAYKMRFMNGTLLAVNEHKNHQKSLIVKQHPERALVQPEDSVTLQCSLLPKNKENRVQCPGEHNVYWFRAGSGQSHPDVIYTHRNSSDEQEERSCVYSLSKTIRNSSDTGTYYCAVVSCGEILFGEGTTVETRQEVSFLIVLGTLLACCVIVIVALIVSRNKKTVCEHCKGGVAAYNHAERDRSSEDQSR
ncbi:uncharacterized protein LOC127375258 isoform X2 [Dicentrarchus labrax]|uniref:uncharacterized protein LOC127375258 isoform X2 n=1 Tax=Dicentrarchus labrax TaxID=13489 RepID=UPI0021F684CC|nr:uncharacterized protein LOC127375258 isoform X2 [Dicentrarchus labrax]